MNGAEIAAAHCRGNKVYSLCLGQLPTKKTKTTFRRTQLNSHIFPVMSNLLTKITRYLEKQEV